MRLSPPSGIMDVADSWRKRKLARGETCMSAQENMTLARRFMEARVTGDLDALDEIMTPDYVSHAKLLPDQQPDREGEKMGGRSICRRLFQAQVASRGPGSRGRQGGDPLHRALYPRSGGDYGRGS